jgi:hypothetical protein
MRVPLLLIFWHGGRKADAGEFLGRQPEAAGDGLVPGRGGAGDQRGYAPDAEEARAGEAAAGDVGDRREEGGQQEGGEGEVTITVLPVRSGRSAVEKADMGLAGVPPPRGGVSRWR